MTSPIESVDHLQDNVLLYAHKDIPLLDHTLTIGEALDFIYWQGIGERIVYFYVVDEEKHLLGIIPTRRLLTADRDVKVTDVMVKRLVKLPHNTTLMNACESFALHKFLALPVVDENDCILGVLDINLFTDEILTMDNRNLIDHVFETIGYRFSDVRNASAIKTFQFRFPWLIATIVSGTFCAIITGLFAVTLAKSMILAFFLAMLLGLGESVSMQSMTVTFQMLRQSNLTMGWYWKTFKKEILSAILLGTGCGMIVSIIVWVWKGFSLTVVSIGFSIFFSLIIACIIGITIPTILHAQKLDPKVSAGPITLAAVDICSLSIYFTLAYFLL